MLDDWFPIVVILGIISIALFGGAKNAQFIFLQPPVNTNTGQNTSLPEAGSNTSSYTNKVNFHWGSFGNKPDQEYIEIDASSNNTNAIDITGWKIRDNSSNYSVTIPQSTGLYSANEDNYNQDVILSPGEQAYIITGRSPIGYGMHVNICSGYLTQFNTFSPSLYTSCPSPQSEAHTRISRTTINNTCLDLIDRTPACTIRSTALDNTYTSECQQLFSNTLTYQGCINGHRRDADFYSPNKWYVYLNRDNSLWNVSRQSATLLDATGNNVQTITK